MPELWTEKYRPSTLDEYVWRDPDQRAKVEEWLAEGSLPHLLFTGPPGCGKTSLAKLMLRILGIPNGDILTLNASKDRLADAVQTKITNFVSTWACNPTGIKYVLLDECDRMSPLAQDLLRNEMETYHESCRFILTGNNPARIQEALHSRCQGFQFSTLDMTDFATRVAEILTVEGVQFDLDVMLGYAEKVYPDLRKCINLVQQSVRGNVLQPLRNDDLGVREWLFEVVDLFKVGKYRAGRERIVAQAQVDEYPEIYKFFYQNLALWGGDDLDRQDDALLIIRNGLVNHAAVCDPEINLSATLVELSRIATRT